MKKIFWIAAALGLLSAASCQKKELTDSVQSPEEKAVAVVSVKIPQDIATKVYSDGTTATQLHYAVYRAGEFLFGNEEDIAIALQADVDITLVKNVAYDIVFWAQSPDGPYAFDKKGKKITVQNYTSAANDEDRDAFYQVVKGYVYTPEATVVELYRPFAQINFGASDYDEVVALLGDECMTSDLTVAGLPDVLNVLDGTVEGNADAAFTVAAVPAQSGETLVVEGAEYGYVSMNYVLAPKEKNILTTLTGTFYYNNDHIALTVANVPYQRNYRTNIIGEFFTGTADFNIVIDPIYDNPDYNQNN